MDTLVLSRRLLACFVLLLILFTNPGATLGNPNKALANSVDRTNWWQKARFGLFIHWGLYALPACSEWQQHFGEVPAFRYAEWKNKFQARKFNPSNWVKLAQQAGCRYLVFTAKHHEGFSMFFSKHSHFDVEQTPFHRDAVKELSQACQRARMPLGLYYSILDWHHEDYLPRPFWDNRPNEKASFERYNDFVLGQVEELLANYGPIAVLWFDGAWDHSAATLRSKRLLARIRSMQNKTVVNDRLFILADHVTHEQKFGQLSSNGPPWELCLTTNDTWGYSVKDNNWKSSQQIIERLAQVVSLGGNLLLNVGPQADGTIPLRASLLLQNVGRWLSVNGEAIYGAGSSVYNDRRNRGNLSFGYVTQKSNNLYAIISKRPKDNKIILPRLLAQNVRAILLASGQKLLTQRKEDGLVINLPKQHGLGEIPVIKISCEAKPDVLDQAITALDNGSIILSAEGAKIHGKTARFESDENKRCIGYWTNANDWLSWRLEVPRNGDYDVFLTWACPAGVEGTDFSIKVRGNSSRELRAKVEKTNSWKDFKKRKIGRLFLVNGVQQISLKPLEKRGIAVMNLRSIELRKR